LFTAQELTLNYFLLYAIENFAFRTSSGVLVHSELLHISATCHHLPSLAPYRLTVDHQYFLNLLLPLPTRNSQGANIASLSNAGRTLSAHARQEVAGRWRHHIGRFPVVVSRKLHEIVHTISLLSVRHWPPYCSTSGSHVKRVDIYASTGNSSQGKFC